MTSAVLNTVNTNTTNVTINLSQVQIKTALFVAIITLVNALAML